jgi:hypothetical protein
MTQKKKKKKKKKEKKKKEKKVSLDLRKSQLAYLSGSSINYIYCYYYF